MVASIFCQGLLENSNVFFTYDAVLFDGGNVFVTASVSDGAFQTEGTGFYAPTQGGAATAAVNFQRDEVGTPNGGFFTLSLDRATLVTTIEYTDNEARGGKLVWTMPPSACINNKY
jgi:hypothetical protein